VYLAALLGVVLARLPIRVRITAATVVFGVGLAEGFAFRIWSTLPATVPVAVALGVILLRRETREATLQA
jgi:Na+-translocating ferredoxin:NAD+ oxidoreductase RnfE subunit